MLIRSKIVRAKGTRVQFGKGKDRVEYHFKALDPKRPLEDHVCDVESQAHIAALLAITEGYEVHASEVKSRVKSPPPPPKQEAKAEEQEQEQADNEGDPAEPGPYDEMDKAQLVDLVAARTGKKPHPTTKREKLVATLAALDEAGKQSG